MAWWNRKSKPEDEDQDPEATIGSYNFPPPTTIPLPPKPTPAPDSKPDLGNHTQEVKEHLEKVGIVVPKDPEPDLSTKPADVVGYCFGFVCPKKHVSKPFESITTDSFKERRVCQICGGVAKPATVKRTAEPRWSNCARPRVYGLSPEPDWRWNNAYWSGIGSTYSTSSNDKNMIWTKHEFVQYLEIPKRRKK
jgi:hypothetical protein